MNLLISKAITSVIQIILFAIIPFIVVYNSKKRVRFSYMDRAEKT